MTRLFAVVYRYDRAFREVNCTLYIVRCTRTKSICTVDGVLEGLFGGEQDRKL